MFRFAALALLASAAYAQAPPKSPEFEVASVKLLPPLTPGRASFVVGPARTDIRLTSLAALIWRAYSVRWYQVDWRRAVNSKGGKADGPMPQYDIMATMPAGTSPGDFNLMLQSLLEDRLKLKLHRENREIPSYVLTVAAGGLKIQKVDDPPEPAPPPRVEMEPGKILIREKMPLEKLIATLRTYVDYPMIDQTGLDGTYDIDLRWPYEDAHGEVTAANMESLKEAMKRLGVKMEYRKSPIEVLVLDRFDREPTAN